MERENMLLSSFEYRKKIHREEKLRLAEYVTENFLSPGETIFLGAGTTVSYIGEAIAKRCSNYSFKVWTNNIGLINTWLTRYEKFFAFNFVGIVAGEFSSKNMSVINLTLPLASIPKVIIGSPAISMKGLSADNISTEHQVDSIIKRTQEIIVVADGSKIGKTETYITRSVRMLRLDIRKKKKYILVTTKPAQGEKAEFEKEIARLEKVGMEIKII